MTVDLRVKGPTSRKRREKWGTRREMGRRVIPTTVVKGREILLALAVEGEDPAEGVYVDEEKHDGRPPIHPRSLRMSGARRSLQRGYSVVQGRV